jgi:hypothetical protein
VLSLGFGNPSFACRKHIPDNDYLKNFSFEKLDVGWGKNIANMSWMKIMDRSLTSLIAIEDIGEQVSNAIERFFPRNGDRQF